MTQQSLLSRIFETIDQYREEQRAQKEAETTIPVQESQNRKAHFFRTYISNGGTLLIVLVLILTQNVWARGLQAPSAQESSTSTISYQGKLANSSGSPLTGTYSMIFRLYNVSTGGVHLWEEQWTGPNSVQVSDGLFNIMLGSLVPIPVTIITNNNNLWLGITIGSDDEMAPRVQMGSVPYAIYSTIANLPDDTITTSKIANEAVTTEKIAFGSVSSEKMSVKNDGYITWLATEQKVTGPGWFSITDVNYRPLSITVTTNVILDITLTAPLHSSGSRAAIVIVVDGNQREYIYTSLGSYSSISGRAVLPLGPGTHVISAEIGSPDPTDVYIHGPFSFSVIAFGQ